MSKISPIIYAFVKKYKRPRQFLKKVWQFYLNAKIQTNGFLSGAEVCPPPVKVFEKLKFDGQQDWFQPNAAIRAKLLSKEVKILRKLPKAIDENIHWQFLRKLETSHPETFVIELKNGRVYEEGAVITPDNQLIGEVSKIIFAGEYETDSGNHTIFNQRKLFPLKKIKGSLAVISAPSGRGYYHWMLDVLPRIGLLKSAGYDFEKIDKFLINSYLSKFHIASLEMIGIPKSKIIQSEHNPHIKADLLIVPSLVGNTGSVPKYAIDYIRTEFLDIQPTPVKKNRRIYLNRGQVGHRRVTNEQEVVSLLEKYGFENITLEALSLTEQIALMAQAEVVISPHGAGLTNIIFCNEGTRVIEFFHPAAVNVMYWTICNEMQLEYFYLMAEGEQAADGVNLYLNSDDMKINIDHLDQTLALAKITPSHVLVS